MTKPSVSGTTHTLPFEKLSPRDFERLSLWLVEREGYGEAEHLGAAGSEQGRDLIARREGEQWAFQCKRVRSFGPTEAVEEVNKLAKLPKEERPAGLIFIVTCDVSARTRQQARKRCGELGLECRFWTGTELDEKVKRHSEIVREFFQVSVPAGPGEALATRSAGLESPRQAQGHGRMLLLWGDLPFSLADQVPPDQRRQRLASVPATFEPAGTAAEWLPALPPLPILSLDPGDRVERAFREAGVPLQVVRSRGDVPARDRHSLLKLAGDLETRGGVILSRAEIRELRSDATKRHLLDEAVRAAEGGTLLMAGSDPASDDFQAWWAALGPVFRDAELYAVGDPAAPWPEGVECLGAGLEAARAALVGTGAGSEPEVTYKLTAVRDLLLAGFTAGKLRRLVLYASSPALQPLIHEFSESDGLSAMVEKAITYCQKKDCMADLLAEVKKENPRQYARYEDDMLAKRRSG